MGRPKKANVKSIDEFDAIDLQIIAILKRKPRASAKYLGECVGLGTTAAWQRRKRIKESEPIQEARQELTHLLPLTYEAMENSLSDPETRLSAADKLLRGLGIFGDHSEVATRNIPVTVDDLVDSILKLGTRDQDKLRERITADSGSTERPPSTDA